MLAENLFQFNFFFYEHKESNFFREGHMATRSPLALWRYLATIMGGDPTLAASLKEGEVWVACDIQDFGSSVKKPCLERK